MPEEKSKKSDESSDAKPAKKKIPLPWIIGGAAGAGALLIFCCCGGIGLMTMIGKKDRPDNGGGGGGGEVVAKNDPVLTISSDQLIADFKGNEVAANGKYKGKMVVVSGNIDTIATDIMNKMYVTMGSGQKFDIVHVQCFFSDKHKDEVASVRKGQYLTIRGKCEGKFGNVLMKNCEFVK